MPRQIARLKPTSGVSLNVDAGSTISSSVSVARLGRAAGEGEPDVGGELVDRRELAQPGVPRLAIGSEDAARSRSMSLVGVRMMPPTDAGSTSMMSSRVGSQFGRLGAPISSARARWP